MRKAVTGIVLAGVLVVSAFMAGCGGGSAAPASSKAASSAAASAAAAPAASSAAASSAAASGNTARPESTWDSFSNFYAGITDSEDVYMLLALGKDNTIGAIVFLDTSSSESGSWVGDCKVDGNTMTISDQSNGTALTFSVEESDGKFLLDMGDVGKGLVGEVDKAKFVSAVKEIDAGAKPQF
ncbi:MAG: hypothetical protein IK152_10140 [Lachnospiraceae bacterium]|nr:hypothetical protein [Lachnospiraceae bacterium]